MPARYLAAVASVCMILIGADARSLQSRDVDAVSEMPRFGRSLEYCRAGYSQLEEALRLLDRAQQSDDPGEMLELIGEARMQLTGTRRQISKCIENLDALHSGNNIDRGPGPVSESWVCPMHRQIVQDRPGNCPICDSTMQVVMPAATQPALAGSTEGFTPSRTQDSPGQISGR